MPKPNDRRKPDRVRGRALAAFASAALATAAWAAAPELLPPERAFAFSARGLDPSTVEVRFAIANGYYLYREKLRFSVDPAPVSAAPAFPAGQWKDDVFFGRVETYRSDLVVRLPLERAAAGTRVTVKAESQGCADIGVCYPPQVQQVTIALPAAGTRPGELVEASPAKKRWFE